MRLQTLTNHFRSTSFLIFMAVMLIFPAFELKIQVGLWHLLNSNTVSVKEYEIPVPTGWIAETRGETTSLMELEKHHTSAEFSSIIIIKKPDALEMKLKLPFLWSEEALRAHGVQIFDHRKVEFDGEEANCIISNDLIIDSVTPPKNLPPDSIITITCDSPKDISIRFDGDKTDVETFFSVLSQIRKHNE